MASKYSIVQYVPNPIANERINIGVVAFDDAQVGVRFLTNWDRVRSFGMEDIDFLKDFARRMNEDASSGLLLPGDKQDNTPKHERLTRIAQGWINSIQFTEPRGSLDNVDSLLEDIAESYLVEPTLTKNKGRDRQVAARITTSRIRNIIKQHLKIKNEAKKILRTNYPVSGNHGNNEFDVVVANGQPYFAAHGMSFEVHIPTAIQNSVSWMISDVKNKRPDFPLAIVVLPPRQETSDYKKLESLYKQNRSTYLDLGAVVLLEDEIESWVSPKIRSIIKDRDG
jgi:hypothetical protein